MSGRLGLAAAAFVCLSVCSCSDASAQAQAPQQRAPQPRGPQLNAAPRTAKPAQRSANEAAAYAPQQGDSPQQGPVAPGQPPAGFSPPAPQEPFQLTPAQQESLNRILQTWQDHSGKIESMQCTIHRWESNPVFGKNTQGTGQLKYKAPDQGKYYIEELDADQKPVGVAEHWVCDGNAIYEFDHKNSKLVVRQLPNELKGKAIADGPLPFLFGADANKMKARYWIRQIAPPANQKDKICLEAFPKHQRDAANFYRAEVMLDSKTWMPFALMLEMPDRKSRTTHLFADIAVNSWLQKIKDEIVGDTRTPFGWQRIDDTPPPENPPVAGPPAPGAPAARPQRTAQQPPSAPPARPQ